MRIHLQPWVWSQTPSWLTCGAPGLAVLQSPHIPCPGPKTWAQGWNYDSLEMTVQSFYPPVQTLCTSFPTKMWQVNKVSGTTAEAALPSQSPCHKLLTEQLLVPTSLFKTLLYPVSCIHQPEHITAFQQRRGSFPSLGLLAGLSHVTSLLLYGSNRPQGLLGLAGLMLDKSNSTLLLCGKLESDPESDCALPATGGRKYDGVCGRSSPSASLSASWGLWPWWWCCSWWWCPPWWWGSCIMFSTSESSDWLEC